MKATWSLRGSNEYNISLLFCLTYKGLLVKWIYNLINTERKKSKLKVYLRETMVAENRYKVKLKGAFEYYNVESWARAKKGGTAEY